ncbi:hypothetical protein [Mycolicibacterium wolinskyi]
MKKRLIHDAAVVACCCVLSLILAAAIFVIGIEIADGHEDIVV